MIIRIVYKGRTENKAIEFDTNGSKYTLKPIRGFWDVGCDVFAEAKMFGDVLEIKRRLESLGYTEA